MKAFISEDDIEQSLIQRLVGLGWDWIECDPSVEKQDDVAGDPGHPGGCFACLWRSGCC